MKEFKEINQHIDRHLNEIIFVKCEGTCCGTFRSEAIKRHFKGDVKFPSPSESRVTKGHYNTFLQECVHPDKKYGDEGQPSTTNKNLGKCNDCPNFSFKSKTEKDRHFGMFHRRQGAPRPKGSQAKTFLCNVKSCGKTFRSQPTLSRHQTSAKHGKRNLPDDHATETSKKKRKDGKKRFTIADYCRRNESTRVAEEEDSRCTAEECVIHQEQVESQQEAFDRWVQCGNCNDWFHLKCTGLNQLISDDELKNLDFLIFNPYAFITQSEQNNNGR